MLDESLQFAISQYLDGTLSAEETAALEKRLAEDAEARSLLQQYRKLEGVVRTAAGPAPAVRWEALAAQISSAIDADEAAAAERMRIGSWTARAAQSVRETFAGLSWRIAAPIALAAAMLIAAGIWITNRTEPIPTGPIAQKPVPDQSIAIVQGPRPEAPDGPQHASVEIGPPTSRGPVEAYAVADDLVSVSPNILVIDTAAEAGQDTLPWR